MDIPSGYLPPPEELAKFWALPSSKDRPTGRLLRHWFACFGPGIRSNGPRTGLCLAYATGDKAMMPTPECPQHPGRKMLWLGNEYLLPDGQRVRYTI